jgi:cold shock CspA family protein
VIHKTGMVLNYSQDRKFGWIKQEDGSSIFFHSDNFWDAPPDEIEIGEQVMYVPAVSQTNGKSFARGVRIVSPELIESIGTNTRLYGYVHNPAADKGFGYIVPTYSKAQLFFHCHSVVNNEDLTLGQLVSFRVQEDFKGLTAFEIAPEIEAAQEPEGSKEVSIPA